MSVPTPILVIGGGRMGEAVLAGIVTARVAPLESVVVAEPDASRRRALESAYGVRTTPDVADTAADARTIILAVKPQVIGDVVASLASGLASPGPLVISIAAGIPTERLEALLPNGTPVVRVMPNTPAMVGAGVSAISTGTVATDVHVAMAVELFGALGEVVVLEESLQDAVTGVSGSGPAYVAIFVEALASAGIAQGLDPAAAHALALQTTKGTAELLERTGQSPEELVEAVSSPGGTTVAAREVLADRDISGTIHDAVAAAVARAKELGAR